MKSTESTKSTFFSILFYNRGNFSPFAILSVFSPISNIYVKKRALHALGASKGEESIL